MKLAIAGNPNSGKTTLFNHLTGSNQRVGNFPGVTVERKTGAVSGRKGTAMVDLPGIYSLSPYSAEEMITRDFLLGETPDAIINIIDAASIERGLYLTLQLIELGIPVVLALNMMDEVQANGGSVDIQKMRDWLGIPVVPISARNKQGLSELLDAADAAARGRAAPNGQASGQAGGQAGGGQPRPEPPANRNSARIRIQPMPVDFCAGGAEPSGAAHRAIHAISHLIEDHARREGVSVRFAATKLAEGDEPMLARLRLTPNETEAIEHTIREMESELGTDREAAMVDMRYRFIGQLCAECVSRPVNSREYRRSVQIDSVLTHRIWAFPALLGILFSGFLFTFFAGTPLGDLLAEGISSVGHAAAGAMEGFGLNPILQSLVMDGVFAGVGSVLGFAPIILALFFFLSLLEDTGYMARIAHVMDKPLRHIGLSGRSFVPMLMGFGCTVPAVMAARTLPSERDRKMTIFLTPFMSCSAKIPVYAMLIAAFFPSAIAAALVLFALYAMGVALGVLSGFILNHTAFAGAPVPFVMELPNYRFPSPKSVALLLWSKTKDFVTRAFTIIFLASIVIWFLRSFDPRLHYIRDGGRENPIHAAEAIAANRAADDAEGAEGAGGAEAAESDFARAAAGSGMEDSLLASIGRSASAVLVPAGFSDWRAATGLVTGFIAKESVISTLAVLTRASDEDKLADALREMFSPLAAFCFLVFILLYTPCVAAVAITRRELASWKGALLVAGCQTGLAWLGGAGALQIGMRLGA